MFSRPVFPAKLEEKLKATASMAKKEAKVVITGSGYGSMKDHSRLEGHLKYETTESLKKWEKFFETGSSSRAGSGRDPG